MIEVFVLDERLEKDSAPVLSMSDYELRLMNDSRYFWLIYIPKQPAAVEIFDLSLKQQSIIWNTVSDIAKKLKLFANSDKMNIATLGNVVSQLHIHIIGRHIDDAAWPKPVWGQGQAVPYSDDALKKLTSDIKQLLA